MNTFHGHPTIARNEIMRSKPNNRRSCFASFGLAPAGALRPLGNKHSPSIVRFFIAFLTAFQVPMGMPCGRRSLTKWISISKGRTLPKLKVISQFADMEKDRAQFSFYKIFFQSPDFLNFVARRGFVR
jgi:hypothetical protein